MSAKNKPKMAENDREIIISRIFDAPRELVFKAWTEPRHLAQWWGPKGFTNPVCEWDARPGGKIYDVMRAPDGTDYPMGGEFREITAPELLVFSCGALDENGKFIFEFLHTVTFAGQNGKTTVTIRSRITMQTPDADKYIGGYEAGMNLSLDRLAGMFERKDTCTEDREIVASRVFKARRDLVWSAMTDPKHVIHWWGPKGFTMTVEQMDVWPGGVWKHVLHGPDGANYPNKSIFKEVVKHERIVFTHGGRREGGPGVSFVATWTFDEVEPDSTRLTVRMVFATAEERDFVVREFGAIEGAKQTLERLSELLPRIGGDHAAW